MLQPLTALEPKKSSGRKTQKVISGHHVDETVASFTLLFGCRDPALIPRCHLCVNLLEAARGEILLRRWSASGGSIRGKLLCTEPVAMDEPAVCIQGVSIWRVESGNNTGPSLNLIKRNVPQSNLTEPN